ncbi:Small glutamine-rich tetratricopeptide repeat-containing protein [Actinidia chinensis var. chinensis]|uniref:Small glutamine-rich tetratricopeptide repeat-containing protein n=1 Tax=Actinidia chinensis var. chinensis TaxID=1590841 RepID=A0A2R6RE16_ACTCC|nr:Small glutamine-rich tetratricopeptide repeat-containing protein [Actinidia chinensis var. chinensis]
MGTDVLLQLAILILTLALFFAMHKFPKQALTKLRSRGRASAQAHRHFFQGAQLLARARSARNRTTAIGLAKDAAAQADRALSLDPKDAAAHILKALALDLMGHKLAALRSLDTALSPPAVKSLSEREIGDAMFKRAELHVAVNRRRRVDSAVADLLEAVRLSPDHVKAYCLLGQCYEMKGMQEEARTAFETAIKLEPGSIPAREALNRLGLAS